MNAADKDHAEKCKEANWFKHTTKPAYTETNVNRNILLCSDKKTISISETSGVIRNMYAYLHNYLAYGITTYGDIEVDLRIWAFLTHGSRLDAELKHIA
jgi:hypothetical protein